MPKWRPNLRCDGTIGGKRKPIAEILGQGLVATVGRVEVSKRICDVHNADIDALTAERDALARRINPDGAPVDVTALCLEIDEATAERDEWKEKERITSELFEAACNDLGDAQEELAAAIEYAHSRDAEVDELQRRLVEVVKMLDMNTKPRPKHEDFVPFNYNKWNDAVCAWDQNAARHAHAVAIAEGRTE